MEAWGSALTRGKQIAKGDPEVAVPELGRRYWRIKCALWILTWVSGLSQQTMCKGDSRSIPLIFSTLTCIGRLELVYERRRSGHKRVYPIFPHRNVYKL